MPEEEKQDGQKTIVAFIVGLLIGGLLVWVFSGSPAESPATSDPEDTVTETTDESDPTTSDLEDVTTEDGSNESNGPATPSMTVGDGSVDVRDQAAGYTVALDGAVFPTSEGWIGVRQSVNGQLGSLLGVVRYSEEQGLVPENIVLQAPTTAGREYAIVFYTESGDREFSLADDVQIDEVFATFTAQ